MGRAFSIRMRGTDELVDASRAAPVFEEFFSATRQDLFGAVWLVTRNRHEAEEIVQEAFVKVWERWERVRTLEDPTGYLVQTAMNVWRSRGRRAALAIRRAVHTGPPPDDGIAEAESRDAVIRALAPLTPRQRAALVLTDLLGFTSEEAGDALGVRASTVRVLAKRGRDQLKETLDG